MSEVIYDKTNKGREEITTRSYHLALRLRTLLVIVDGKQTVTELLKKIVGLGLGEQHLQELIDEGFVAPIETAPVDAIQEQLPQATDTACETPTGALTEAHVDISNSTLTSTRDAADQFRNVYSFFKENIKSKIGIRGFNLQLKVERAGTLQDLEELRRPFLEAIFKAKGEHTLVTLSVALDALLGSSSADIVIELINT